jgi:hypothetical protein
MKKSFKEAKTRARHYQAPFDGKSQVNAKKSIDFSERMETNTTSPQEIVPTIADIETNTTSPQEIVPTIADIDRGLLEIECGKDLLTSTDTEIGLSSLSSMRIAGRHSIYEI